MDDDLNDILADEAESPAAPTGAGASAAQATGDFSGDDHVSPDDGPPPSFGQEEPGHIPVAALRDERQKRQQLEAQLEQYETYFSQLQQQAAQPPAMPDMYEDPGGYTAWIAAQVRDHVMQEVQQAGEQYGSTTRAEVSELLARQKYEDYEQKIEVFKQAMIENPFLIDQVKRAADPANFAYQAAGKYLEAKQYGSSGTSSRGAIEAQIRQQIMSELGLSSTPRAPSSLASERSIGSRSGPAWSGPTALGDLLA
jgi:hypothetical protein